LIKIDKKAYSELIVGMRTIFASTIKSWWCEKNYPFGYSSWNDFAISITGLCKNGNDSFSFCDSDSSRNKLKYLKLFAAQNLFLTYFDKNVYSSFSELTPNSKDVFSKAFLATWAVQGSWVKIRMIEMARRFGNQTLIEPMIKFLKEINEKGGVGMERNSNEAINLLATLTDIDFRFEKDGIRREVSLIAKDYFKWYFGQ
jgi:hypothetical protein